jgi:hypothetical protein
MKRLTMKDVHAMNMTELALNQVFVQNGWAWYIKAPEDECSVCGLIRDAAKALDVTLAPELTDEELGDILLDWLQFGEKEPEGVLAILYRALWAMAEVRERLKLYEDAMPLERAQELAQAEKNGRLVGQKPPIPGDNIWIVERDEYKEPIDISGYMFLAFSGRAVIVSAFINDFETLDETVEYHIEETSRYYETDLAVFPKNDCYLTRKEAEAALKKREDTK